MWLGPNHELERLVDAFKSCVSVLGSSDTLPLARTGPSAVVWYDIVRLSDGFSALAIVSHAFSHSLVLDQDSGLLYIVQIGGFFDDETLFGPFTADEGCAEARLSSERSSDE